MVTDLRAGSRHRYLVLFDPAAIPAGTPVDPDLDAQDPRLLPAGAMRTLTETGAALIIHIDEEDAEAVLRVFVDEAPPAIVIERGMPVLAGAALRSPSGTLNADGLEFMTVAGTNRSQSEAESMQLPAGDYDVEVRNLIPWKLANRAAVVARGARPIERAVHTFTLVYTWIGVLLIFAHLFGVPGLAIWFSRHGGWRAAAPRVVVILIADAILLGSFWALSWARSRFPDLFRIAAAGEAFDRENPDVAIVLRRRAQSADAAGAVAGAPAFVRLATTSRTAAVRAPAASRR